MMANVSFMGVSLVVRFRSTFQTFLLMPFGGQSSRAMFTHTGNFFWVKYRTSPESKNIRPSDLYCYREENFKKMLRDFATMKPEKND